MSRILTNNKALIFIIAVLLLANIAMIVMFLGMRHPQPRPSEGRPDQGKERLSYILKNEIKFDKEQLKQFDSLKKEHWNTFKPLFKGMNSTKDRFYKHLGDSVLDETVLALASDSIAIRQKAMDVQVFSYFRKVRDLCTPAQRPAYDSVIQNVVKRMIAPQFKRGDSSDPRRDITKDSLNRNKRP